MLRINMLLIMFLLIGCDQKTANRENVGEVDQAKVTVPNIIYILADDLGYGDLGIYGQSHFQTPNIDSLGYAGIQFMRHYSGSTVCAPSRSALLTGMHTGHTPIRGNLEVQPEGQHPIGEQVYTLAEMLRDSGYITGAFGKWGLGYPGSEGDPLNQGFDTFFGYNCQRLGHSYYPNHLWDDNEQVFLEGNVDGRDSLYGPELIHDRLLSFIEKHRNEPFFAYVPSIIPHAELKAPEAYMAKYRGKFLPEKEYEGCDAGCENFRIGGYESQKEAHAAFSAMIHLLDDQVGEIVGKLKALGILDNTLIIFSSDNGPHLEGGADPDYFNSNGPLRGYKRDLYEGGIRVPMLISWPDVIEGGQVTNHVSAFWDVFPTLAQVAGISNDDKVDGISFLPTLLGKQQSTHEFLYWEFISGWATSAQAVIIEGQWKAVRKINADQFTAVEVYDLHLDEGEQRDVAIDHPEIVRRAEELFAQEHISSEVQAWHFVSDRNNE